MELHIKDIKDALTDDLLLSCIREESGIHVTKEDLNYNLEIMKATGEETINL